MPAFPRKWNKKKKLANSRKSWVCCHRKTREYDKKLKVSHRCILSSSQVSSRVEYFSCQLNLVTCIRAANRHASEALDLFDHHTIALSHLPRIFAIINSPMLCSSGTLPSLHHLQWPLSVLPHHRQVHSSRTPPPVPCFSACGLIPLFPAVRLS